jgi:hypothetical protein
MEEYAEISKQTVKKKKRKKRKRNCSHVSVWSGLDTIQPNQTPETNEVLSLISLQMSGITHLASSALSWTAPWFSRTL